MNNLHRYTKLDYTLSQPIQDKRLLVCGIFTCIITSTKHFTRHSLMFSGLEIPDSSGIILHSRSSLKKKKKPSLKSLH